MQCIIHSSPINNSVSVNNMEKGGIARLTEVEKDELLKNTKLRIKYRGVGHCGFDLSVIKSALQKGVRRNEHDLVKWNLRESYLYYAVGITDESPQIRAAAKAFNTNIINRLYIIAVEDCSPRALVATNKCAESLKKYATTRDPEYLMKAGLHLSLCPSSRVCSHLRELCGVGGLEFNGYEQEEEEGIITIGERLKIIFETNIKGGGGELSASALRSLRAVSAYHALKVYHQLVESGNLNRRRGPTGADKKKKNSFIFGKRGSPPLNIWRG